MAIINATDIFNETIGAEGIFDVLLQDVENKIIKEYKSSRIKGSDYSTVYLGALQVAISESINFALNKQQSDAQAELLKQQLAVSIADEARKNQQLTIDLALKQEQIDASRAARNLAEIESNQKILMMQAQLDELNLNMELKQKASVADIEQTNAQTTAINNKDTRDAVVTGVQVKEIESNTMIGQLKSDSDLKRAAKEFILLDKDALQKDQDTLLTTEQVTNAQKDAILKDKDSLIKIQEEALLSGQVSLAAQDLILKGKDGLRKDQETALLAEQVILAQKDAILKDKDSLIKIQEEALITQQAAIAAQDVILKGKDALRKDQETALLTKQVDIAAQDVLIKAKDLLIRTEEVGLKVTANSIALKELDIKTQDALIKVQELNVIVKELDLRTQSLPYDLAIKTNTADKILADKVLTRTQQRSETGKWANDIPLMDWTTGDVAAGTAVVGGVLSTQKALYRSQALGFFLDGKYKSLKLKTDTWSVAKSVEEIAGAPFNNDQVIAEAAAYDAAVDTYLTSAAIP